MPRRRERVPARRSTRPAPQRSGAVKRHDPRFCSSGRNSVAGCPGFSSRSVFKTLAASASGGSWVRTTRFSPSGSCLGCGHIDLGAGMFLQAALAHIGNDANHAGVFIADALSQTPHRILARPIAASGGLVDDDHGLARGRILPAKIAALAQMHAHGAEISGRHHVNKSIVIRSRWINLSLGAKVPAPTCVKDRGVEKLRHTLGRPVRRLCAVDRG